MSFVWVIHLLTNRTDKLFHVLTSAGDFYLGFKSAEEASLFMKFNNRKGEIGSMKISGFTLISNPEIVQCATLGHYV